MRQKVHLLAFFCAFLLPVAAFAHEGHGAFSGHELAHYLTSPAHVIPVLAGLVLLGVYFLVWRPRRQSSDD